MAFVLVAEAPYKILQMGAQKKQKWKYHLFLLIILGAQKKGQESKAGQGTTAACFTKEIVLQPKRTRKLCRSDKASKGNLGEISASPMKEKVSGEQERGGKVVRRGDLHPAQASEKEVFQKYSLCNI